MKLKRQWSWKWCGWSRWMFGVDFDSTQWIQISFGPITMQRELVSDEPLGAEELREKFEDMVYELDLEDMPFTHLVVGKKNNQKKPKSS